MDGIGPRFVASVIGFGCITLILIAAATTNPALGPFNDAWDGTTSIRDRITEDGGRSDVIVDVSTYEDLSPNGTVVVILSPNTSYDSTEYERIKRFVDRGGTVLVAEDFGPHGNELLQAIGASARVDQGMLRDDMFYEGSPSFPVVENVTQESEFDSTTRITLNQATAVHPNGASVLVRSSSYSYLDENFNGKIDRNESIGRHPIATIESVGQGEVIVFGDPSVFINAMQRFPGNRRFTDNLIQGHQQVVFDYSHAEGTSWVVRYVIALRGSFTFQLVLGLLGAVGVASWMYWPRTRRVLFSNDLPGSVSFTTDELERIMKQSHLESDEHVRGRIIKGLKTNLTSRRDDDEP